MKHAFPVLALLSALAINGCHRQDVPAHPSKADTLLKTPQDSVAAPVSSLPTPDAAIGAAAPPPAPQKTDSASGPSQASADQMTKQQEASAMPLAGQANNHSTPAAMAPAHSTDLPSQPPK